MTQSVGIRAEKRPLSKSKQSQRFIDKMRDPLSFAKVRCMTSSAKQLIMLALVLSMGATAAAAGPFEDGMVAYKAADYTTAFRLWQPLAQAGDPGAQNNLGVMYEKGFGVAMDYEAAAAWYRKAAVGGNANAMENLADLEQRGLVTAGPPPQMPAAAQPDPGT
jgi:TPR repeat protein